MAKEWKITSDKELKIKVEEYFQHCTLTDEIPDVEGLAVFLDTTRKTLFEYENRKNIEGIEIDFESISNTIKKALKKISMN